MYFPVPPLPTNMWMHYSAEYWVKAEDLGTAIQRLACQLYDLSMDSLHAANYDMDYCYDTDAQQRLMKNSEQYTTGANTCNKYTHGILNLEEFCQEMLQLDLRRFLYDICEYLPNDIIVKFQLNQSDDSDEEDEDVDKSINI